MIIFENKGELDIRAIKTFGVNSKDNPGSAIGYFGTGLKYALAILLRAKHEVSIITGGVKYKFGVKTSKIRNDNFDIVTMNGKELGFTTELGKNWEMWMAFREIMSNCIDESGEVYEVNCLNMTLSDKTYVIVSGGAFENEYRKRDNYFLNRSKFSALHAHAEVDLYEKTHSGEKGHIFFKGVRVMETRGNGLFDYDHHSGLTLTEDRTIKDSWSTLYHVGALVMHCKDAAFIKKMVMCDPLVYEARVNYTLNCMGNVDFFLDTVGELRKKYKDAGFNHSAIEIHKKLRDVQQVMPTVSCSINNVQAIQLEKALDFCKNTLELELDDYKLIICKDIGIDGDLGRADIEQGIMYISKKCFSQGTKRVAVALLEEYTHCKHEVLDETLSQKWIYLEQIMSLGERIDGEPL